MKTQSPLHLLNPGMLRLALSCLALAAFALPGGLRASPLSAVSEVIEQLTKKSGRIPAHGMAEALQAAYRLEGEAALRGARLGGMALGEIAARQGENVYRMAARVPEAIPALIANADTLVPLAIRHGDEILILESRLPGLASTAAARFPSSEHLALLNSLPVDQAKRILMLSAHATDSAAAPALLKTVKESGPSVLDRLNPTKIAAIGLSASMVTGATSLPIAALKAPEALITAVTNLLGIPVFLFSAAALLALLLWLGVKFQVIRRMRRLITRTPFRDEPKHLK